MQEIEAARAIVLGAMPATPQYSWPLLNERLGGEVWVKHENHSPGGAFKLRGALVYATWLRETVPGLETLVAATRGNHGQGVAMAARLLGLKAVVVVPLGNSREKNLAMKAQGAELIEMGGDFQESLEYARGLAGRRGCAFVESIHTRLVMGTATYALEFLRAAPALGTVYVPIGLGSSICGVAAARNALGKKHKNGAVEIVGVVAEAAPAYLRSFQERRVVEAAATTKLADGLACRVPNAEAIEVIWANVARVVAVSEAEIAAGMRAYFEDTHNVAEGAAGAALAGAIRERDSAELQEDPKAIGVILTGGNVDSGVYRKVLEGGL